MNLDQRPLGAKSSKPIPPTLAKPIATARPSGGNAPQRIDTLLQHVRNPFQWSEIFPRSSDARKEIRSPHFPVFRSPFCAIDLWLRSHRILNDAPRSVQRAPP